MVKSSADYESQIEKALESYELGSSYHPFSIDWICNRIDWSWKWHKISREAMENFSDRICAIMEGSKYV